MKLSLLLSLCLQNLTNIQCMIIDDNCMSNGHDLGGTITTQFDEKKLAMVHLGEGL